VTLQLLARYCGGIGWYFVEHEGEPAPRDLEVFRESALHARKKAIEANELEDLRLVIDAVLGHEHSWLWKFNHVLADFVNDTNSQDEEYLRELLAYYRTVIWPDAPAIRPGEPPDVQLTTDSLIEWRRKRDAGEL
jgi:hypothetical protein